MPSTAPASKLAARTVSSSVQALAPVRLDWLRAAARVAGRSKALHAATALAWLAALHGRPDVPLTRRTMASWGLSRDAAGDALRLLRANGLIVVWAAPGRARVVVLVEQGSDTPLALS